MRNGQVLTPPISAGIGQRPSIFISNCFFISSLILVVCGTAVDETVLTDIAIANRFHVASSTMRGVLTVDKSKKFE